MDAEILARVQFAFTVAYHYIYPPLSIGIGLMMVIYEGMFLKTSQKEYETLAKFWIRYLLPLCPWGVNRIVMELNLAPTGPDLQICR
jgi:cytochrome d ubiquinol oxidase subunit I